MFKVRSGVMDRWHQVVQAVVVCIIVGWWLHARLYAAPAKNAPDITYNDVLTMQAQSNPLVIDVRQRHEWQDTGVIAGSYLAEMSLLTNALQHDANALPKQLQDKSNTFMIVCRSGRRSAVVANAMLSLGYKHVYNVQGGILHWQASGGALLDDKSKGVTLWYAS